MADDTTLHHTAILDHFESDASSSCILILALASTCAQWRMWLPQRGAESGHLKKSNHATNSRQGKCIQNKVWSSDRNFHQTNGVCTCAVLVQALDANASFWMKKHQDFEVAGWQRRRSWIFMSPVTTCDIGTPKVHQLKSPETTTPESNAVGTNGDWNNHF